jgi:hypothetical protein
VNLWKKGRGERKRERRSEGVVVRDIIFYAGKQKKFRVFNVSRHCPLVILIDVRLRERERVKSWYVEMIKCWDFVMTRGKNLNRGCPTYDRHFDTNAEKAALE